MTDTVINLSDRRSSGEPLPPKTRRARKKKRNGLHLCESSERDGFTTLDVVNGLHGVCCAMDAEAATHGCQDIDYVADLSMAAKVLSSILASRVEI